MRFLHLGCSQRMDRHFLFDGEYEEVRLDLVPNQTLDVVADMTKTLPFSDDQFDGAQLHHSAEHVTHGSWCETLREIVRVMREDGLVVVAVPDFESAVQWLADGKELEPMYHTAAGIPIYAHDMIYGFQRMVDTMPSMRHLNGFTPRRLYDSFVGAGLVNVVVCRKAEIHELEAIGRKN